MCAIKIVTIDMVLFFASYQIQREQLYRQRSSEKVLRMEGTREQYGRWGGKEYFRACLFTDWNEPSLHFSCSHTICWSLSALSGLANIPHARYLYGECLHMQCFFYIMIKAMSYKNICFPPIKHSRHLRIMVMFFLKYICTDFNIKPCPNM